MHSLIYSLPKLRVLVFVPKYVGFRNLPRLINDPLLGSSDFSGKSEHGAPNYKIATSLLLSHKVDLHPIRKSQVVKREDPSSFYL